MGRRCRMRRALSRLTPQRQGPGQSYGYVSRVSQHRDMNVSIERHREKHRAIKSFAISSLVRLYTDVYGLSMPRTHACRRSLPAHRRRRAGLISGDSIHHHRPLSAWCCSCGSSSCFDWVAIGFAISAVPSAAAGFIGNETSVRRQCAHGPLRPRNRCRPRLDVAFQSPGAG